MHYNVLMLACGPVFPTVDSIGVMLALTLAFVVKPFLYFAFVQAFRFRVSGPAAMTLGEAGRFAAMRFVFGGVLITCSAALGWWLMLWSFPSIWVLLVPIVLGRIVVWYVLGQKNLRLRDIRLARFALFGALLNIALDVAIVYTAFAGPNVIFHVTFGAVLGFALLVLHRTGMRETLVERFSWAPVCAECGYNLTGNITGMCPECGMEHDRSRVGIA